MRVEMTLDALQDASLPLMPDDDTEDLTATQLSRIVGKALTHPSTHLIDAQIKDIRRNGTVTVCTLLLTAVFHREAFANTRFNVIFNEPVNVRDRSIYGEQDTAGKRIQVAPSDDCSPVGNVNKMLDSYTPFLFDWDKAARDAEIRPLQIDDM
jgi:hypothetical protein